MEKITILAPAKINLFLRVGDRRKDGYHDIETVMQTVTMFDRLEVCKNESEADAVIDVSKRASPTRLYRSEALSSKAPLLNLSG